jgi:hypothetical protein
MLVLALVSPFAALGLLFVMQGFEGWLLDVAPDAFSPDATAVAGIAEKDLAAETTILHGGGIAQPRLPAVAAQADPLGPRAQQIAAATYSSSHWVDAA